MKNTKEKILANALKLFNNYGLSKITLRTIAKEMGISQGNLNYHFKKRAHIIEALYFQLVSNIDTGMSENTKPEIGLGALFNSSKAIMKNFFEYRFFMLDFVQIMRENARIKTHYYELSSLREKQFISLFQLTIKNGLMRKEILPNEYINLYKRYQILGDFWISSALTVHSKITKETVQNYSEILIQAIFPYLTEEGKKEYFSLQSK